MLRDEVGCWLGGCCKPAFFPSPSKVGQIPYLKCLSHNHVPLLTMAEFHLGNYLINVCLLHATVSLPHCALGRRWVEAGEDQVRARLLGG